MYSYHRVVCLFLVLCTATPSMASRAINPPDQVSSDQVSKDEQGRFIYNNWPKVEDSFIRDTSLHDLHKWIYDQWRAAARAIYDARNQEYAAQGGNNIGCAGGISIQQSRQPLSIKQWNILAKRVGKSIKSSSGQAFIDAWSIADMLDQIGYTDPEFKNKIKRSSIFKAAATRLQDDDPEVVLRASALVAQSANDPNTNTNISLFLQAIETALDRETRFILIRSISSFGIRANGYAGQDEQVVKVMSAILDEHQDDRQVLVYALSTIARAFGAPEQAANAAVKMLDSPNPIARQQAIRTLVTLSSYWDNPSKRSRNKARAITIPAIKRGLHDDSDEVIMQACSVGRYLGPSLASLVPDLIALLDHPNENIRTFTITSLGNIGEASAPALPKLREMDAVKSNLTETITDAIYMIAQEGDKPGWYDDYIKKQKEMIKADD